MAKPNLKIVEDAFLFEVAGCLGNSKRSYSHVSADLLHHAHKDQGMKIETLASMCLLHKTTIMRMMDEGGSDTYSPKSDTNERIHRAFEMTPNFKHEPVKPRFRNKPKNPE